MNLVDKNGTISIVMPAGIVNNEGTKELRSALLKRRIRYLYEFENTKGIFPDIHRSYKFVLLIVDNCWMSGEFPSAFYVQDIGFLDEGHVTISTVKLSPEFIKLVSPMTFLIPEMRSNMDIRVFKKLYKLHPLIVSGFNGIKFTLMRELNRTESAHLFKTSGKGWPLVEGKTFHQFIINYEKPIFTIPVREGLLQTSNVREYGAFNKHIHDVPRLVFRKVASSTNVRCMIACIIPKNTFVAESATLVIPKENDKFLNDKRLVG